MSDWNLTRRNRNLKKTNDEKHYAHKDKCVA